MDIDIELLFMIVISISLVGSVVGGTAAALIEQRLLGSPDKQGEYKPQRSTASLSGLVIGTAVGYITATWAQVNHVATFFWTAVTIGLFSGLVAYLLGHITTYISLLKKNM